MKLIILGAVFCVLTQTAWPCANFTGGGTKYDGGEGIGNPKADAIRLHVALKKNLRVDGRELEAKLRGSTNFNDRSDYSIALMYLGRSGEAVTLLEKLEAERPGEYFIAANLGTAYELSGINEKALKWINEGIHRNPKSHEGTEWLHAKILEAKIAAASDNTFFEKHSVLELEPGRISESIDVNGTKLSPEQLARAIEYQLSERMQFVKPPDPAVASLLFDYAAIEAATRSMEGAKKILEMADQYGYPRNKIVPLVAELDQKIFAKKLRDRWLLGVIGSVVILLLVVAYKRGIFVLSSKDLKKRL
jgi:hypothetical protein